MKHPCKPWWIAAGVLLALGLLVPTYFYVRILPIAVALIIGCYCGLYYWSQKQPKVAKIIRWVFSGILIVGLLICTVTGILILKTGSQEPEADLPYIVVLGAKVEKHGPAASLQERIDTAYHYLVAHPNTIAIVSGGQGDDEPITEAQCMYDCLVEMGISPDRLIKEEQATSTWGNLTFSLDIIEAQTGSRPSSLGVVSSEYHLYRTGLQAKEFGLEIIGIPAKTGSFDRWLHYFIREIAGVWHYLLLGGSNQ